MASDKAECKSGHPFTAENTRIDPRTGRRSCKECGRIRSREHQRKKREGTPRLLAYTRDSELYNRYAVERLLGQFCVRSTTGCWLWTAGTNRGGYGNFWYLGRTVSAHRAAYLFLVGEIESDLHLDHLCREPRCINPDHLEPVTCRENILRGTAPPAANSVKTHCIRGHELTEDNLVPSGVRAGKRLCSACARLYKADKSRGPEGDATASGPSIGSREVQP